MKIAVSLLFLLLCLTSLSAYEIPDENEYTTETCRINVKVKVLPDEKMQKPTGRALVTATLTDDEGSPKGLVPLTINANAGTFVCRLPEDTTAADPSAPEDCFTTRYDGIARLYLINITLNTPIKVTASYTCGDSKVSSFATMSISRGKVRRKKGVRRVKPRVQ